MKTYLYIVDYWLPFPSSEYGGLQIIMAHNDIDVFNVIWNSIWEAERDTYSCKELINACIESSKRYEIVNPEGVIPRIVEQFIT